METPGSVLKRERESQKRSLRDIAKTLKINNEYLSAIENDEYHLLPAEIFTKSYIRSYAEALDLDSEYVLDLYNALVHPVQPEEEPVPLKEPEKANYKPALILIIFLLATVLFFISRGNDGQQPDTDIVYESEEDGTQRTANDAGNDLSGTRTAETVNTPKPAVTETERAETDKDKETGDTDTVTSDTYSSKTIAVKATEPAPHVEEKKTTAAENEKPEADKYTKPEPGKPKVAQTAGTEPAGKKYLKVTATELTWVSVSIDSGKPKEWLLRKGETLTLTAHEKFIVKTGNAGGTKLFLNNMDVGELGPHGKVAETVLP